MPIKHLLLLWMLVVGAAALTLLVMFVIGLSLAILLPLALIAAGIARWMQTRPLQ